MSNNGKSLENWIWDAACSIRGAQEAPKFKDFILPLIFTKRLCDVFDDELNRIAEEVGSREKAFKLVAKDHKLVRFYLPLKPKDPNDSVWTVIRKLTGKIGESLTTYLHDIAKANPGLEGIIDRMDFNATTHGQRDIDDDRLSNLIERISEKRLGLKDVEADIIGRSYEFLIRKFAEGGGQSAGEFYTPPEVGRIMALIMDPDPGISVYDPCCGSAGLLIACEHVLDEKMKLRSKTKYAPLRLYGQEYIATTWAMANMNMIIHDMEGTIEIGDTFKTPKFRTNNRLQTFDRVVANPMWSQKGFTAADYANDELDRFPAGAGYPSNRADWGWMQHILASLNRGGKAAVVLGTGAASRGSGDGDKDSRERAVRKWFIENDLIEAVILLPENLFYNTPNAGLIFVLNRTRRRPGEVLMIDVSEYYERGRAKNTLSPEASVQVVESYTNWKAINGTSGLATVRDIAAGENDYNLLPNRYIRRAHTGAWSSGVTQRFESAKRSFGRHFVFDLLARYFDRLMLEVGVSSEIELVNSAKDWELRSLGDCLVPSTLTFNDKLASETAAVLSLTKDDGLVAQSERFGHSVAIEDLSQYRLVKKGWIVYNPMVIWEGAVHALYEPEVGVVSPAYEVWVPVDGIDYRYLDYILKTPFVMDEYRRLSSGGVKRRRIVSARDFCSIRVPIPVGSAADRLRGILTDTSLRLDDSMERLIEDAIRRAA